MFPAVSTGQDISGLLAWILAYLFLITIFIFAVHIIIAMLVYRDSKHRGLSNIWALIFMILPIVFYYFGIFIYLICLLVVAIMYAVARSRMHGFQYGSKRHSGWRR